MILEEGRVCIVKKGNDFGKLCMVLTAPKGNKVEIEGPKIKKREINIFHIWPLDKVLAKSDAKNLDKKVKI